MLVSDCVLVALSRTPVDIFPETRVLLSRDGTRTGIDVGTGCPESVSRVDRSGIYVAETRRIRFLHLMMPTTAGQDGNHVVNYCYFQRTLCIRWRPKRYLEAQQRGTGNIGSQ